MKYIISVLMLVTSGFLFAAPVVIGNATVENTLTEAQVKKLFLGKLKKLPNGAAPIVIEYPSGTPIRAEFHSSVTKKSETQLKAYWSKLIFTGKGTPPNELGSSEEVIDMVSRNPDAIGYVDSSEVTDGVKVLF